MTSAIGQIEDEKDLAKAKEVYIQATGRNITEDCLDSRYAQPCIEACRIAWPDSHQLADAMVLEAIQALSTMTNPLLTRRERQLAALLAEARTALFREWVEAGAESAKAAFIATEPRC